MRKSLRSILALLFCLSINIVMINGQTTITLVHVNDTHSHLDAFGPKNSSLDGTLGGISRAATIIGTIKATEPNVILLHGGDFMVGDFFFNKYFGVPELQIMQQLGFDAIAVGNHEFDLGPANLNDILTGAFTSGSIPLLSSNLDMSAYPPLQTWIQPTLIKTVSGVKVGMFGLTIPDPMNNAAPVVISSDVIAAAMQSITALQESGAQVIVMVSHMGIMYDQQIAANLPGIDFVISAHDHNFLPEPVVVQNPEGKFTRIVESGSFYEHVGKLQFTYNNGQITNVSYSSFTVDATVPPVAEIQAVIDELKLGIVAQYGDVYHTAIGTAVNDLEKSALPESENKDTPLGNLVTDAFRYKTSTSLAITANGLIAEKIYHGSIVGNDVFHSLCYGFNPANGLGFNLVKFDILGSELLKGLELGLAQIETNEDYFIQVSGMKFKYSSKRPAGHRVIQGSVKTDNGPLVPVNYYSCTVNEGLLGLLSSMGVSVQNITPTDISEYGALKDFITHLNTVDYSTEGRVIDMSLYSHGKFSGNDKQNVPEKFRLNDNYPNPFNPSTTISYYLPVKGYVNLTVFDLTGRKVDVLVDGIQDAGSHQVIFQGSRLASGVYFYRLVYNGLATTKKMILTK